MFVWRGHLLLVWLLIDYTSADKNVDIKDASADEAFHDYDEHGCDRAAGEYYCPRKSRCISTWESCEPLLGKNDDCTATWSGLTWDLSPLKGKTATILDDSGQNTEYAYAFSICGNADLGTSQFTDHLVSKCQVTTGAAGESISTGAPVFQGVKGEYCERAGEDQSGSSKERFKRGNQMTWSLLDPLNPAMGLELAYTGGNTCKRNMNQDNAESCDTTIEGKKYCTRGFKIRMVCNPEVEYLPLENSVEEDAGCTYVVRVNSKYACPTQCPWGSNGKVCSGKGLCYFSGYDDDNTRGSASAYCLCKTGTNNQEHKGSDCGVYSRWGVSYKESL